jgi:hypothetical protein
MPTQSSKKGGKLLPRRKAIKDFLLPAVKKM